VARIAPQNDDLIVAKSRTGNGVFTTRTFKAGEVLIAVTGTFVTCDVDDDMDETERANTYRYDMDRYVSPGNSIGNFVNHSCVPNAKVMKRREKLYVVAHTTIPNGSEVLFDYSTITARDDEWTMRCRCGNATCRKVIRAFHALPDEVRARYIREGIVPRYILAIDRELA